MSTPSKQRKLWPLAVGILVVGALVVGIVLRDGLRPSPPAERPSPAAGGPEEAVPSPHAAPDAPAAAGQELYANHCSLCHGDKGDGEGTAARFLYPKPRNFREGKFRLVTTSSRLPSDDDLMNVVTRGMPGSAMVPFGHLPEADRRALIAHVRRLVREGIEERLRQAAAAAGDEVDPEQLKRDVDRLAQIGQAMTLPANLPAGPESVARGLEVYRQSCATCHGDTGKGDGGKEQRDDDGTPTRPRDFTRGIFKGGRDRLQLYARIAIGMPGTPMPSSPSLKEEQVGDLVNYVQSLSDPAAQAKVEHKRQQLAARRVAPLPDDPAAADWNAVPATPVVLSPLWWREYDDPDFRVQVVHDGKTLAVRLSWRDIRANDAPVRTEDFEDMAAVQLFKGASEPFLGMGTPAAAGAGATKPAAVDLWLWRASWSAQAATPSILDDYPFDEPIYRGVTKGREKQTPDFLTARAAGNPNVPPERPGPAGSLAAKGFGSTTFRPKTSQLVTARSEWKDGRWTVVLRRPLQVGADDGLPLAAGERCSAAFAVWDGAANDRNGQKLISIWHDLTLE